MGSYRVSEEEILSAIIVALDSLEGDLYREDVKRVFAVCYDNYKDFTDYEEESGGS